MLISWPPPSWPVLTFCIHPEWLICYHFKVCPHALPKRTVWLWWVLTVYFFWGHWKDMCNKKLTNPGHIGLQCTVWWASCYSLPSFMAVICLYGPDDWISKLSLTRSKTTSSVFNKHHNTCGLREKWWKKILRTLQGSTAPQNGCLCKTNSWQNVLTRGRQEAAPVFHTISSVM